MLKDIADIFSSNPEVSTAINNNADMISRVNHFIFGINLAEAPGFKLTPAILIPIVSALCQLLSMLVMPKTETGDPQQDAQMNSMRRSMYFMPIMSFIVTVSAPAGLGIYWATSAFISFLITIFTNIYYDHIADMEQIVEKQRIKAEKDIAKRKASGKKSLMERYMDAASGKTTEETSESNSSSGNAKLARYSNMNLKNFDSEVEEINEAVKENVDTDLTEEIDSVRKPKKGSMADKAAAVKRFNEMGEK